MTDGTAHLVGRKAATAGDKGKKWTCQLRPTRWWNSQSALRLHGPTNSRDCYFSIRQVQKRRKTKDFMLSVQNDFKVLLLLLKMSQPVSHNVLLSTVIISYVFGFILKGYFLSSCIVLLLLITWPTLMWFT